jgi:exonuclease SbcC
MKPLKLTMSAFGSYADVQTLEFDKLGANGLYLITGDTGSGKTTIFDAISFALFGKASGAGRSDYTMLRSDFADDKAKTFVDFTFASGDKRYNIRRGIKKDKQEVVLALPDGTFIDGDRSTKPKIAEIIGLDRDQFAQIVMIAQNDFLRFLQSGTDDRLNILRRIFGTEALRQFQEQLKALANKEKENRQMILRDFDRYGVDVNKRVDQFSEWEAQIVSDKAELSETDRQIGIYDRQKQTLAAELAVSEDLFKKCQDLAGFRAGREEHGARADEIKVKKTRALRGETALRKVKPSADDAHRAVANYAAAQADLRGAQEQETAAHAEFTEAQKAIDVLPPLAEAQNAFAVLSKECETACEKLKRLTALQAARTEIAGKQDTLSGVRADLDAAVTALVEMPPVAGCQAELDAVTKELEITNDRLIKLSGLQSEFTGITNTEAELAKRQKEFESSGIDFNDADARYRAAEEAFLRNQAGIIAAGLTDGQPCPVCGSPEHPAPARVSGDDISEEKLKKTREIKDAAQSKRNDKASQCAVLKNEIETLSRRFMADLAELAPGAAPDRAAALLPEITGAAQSAAKSLAEKKTRAEKSLADLKLKFETATGKRDKLTPKAAALDGEITTLIKRFISDFSEFVPGAEWETSDTALADVLARTQNTADVLTARRDVDKNNLDRLTADWNSANERTKNAETALAAAQTLTVERAAHSQKLTELSGKAQSAFTAALRENNFTDEAEYTAALVTDTELEELNRHISDYDKRGEQLTRDIDRLEKETAGKEPPDIERLRAGKEAAETESLVLSGKRDEILSRLTKTENALIELHRAAADFEKAESSYAIVKQLSDTANGKLDFETYAQMAYFERVIRAANIRLRLMSQNRYLLQRKTASDDGRKRSGLELEVLDAYTGKTRSASSLSGGESFTASLSLALGLSDIVQQSTGCIRLDAMFIDEGFGSLDTEVLELAIRTLSELAGTDRIIGIISHVSELRERIDKQVRVEKTATGSIIHVT